MRCNPRRSLSRLPRLSAVVSFERVNGHVVRPLVGGGLYTRPLANRTRAGGGFADLRSERSSGRLGRCGTHRHCRATGWKPSLRRVHVTVWYGFCGAASVAVKAYWDSEYFRPTARNASPPRRLSAKRANEYPWTEQCVSPVSVSGNPVESSIIFEKTRFALSYFFFANKRMSPNRTARRPTRSVSVHEFGVTAHTNFAAAGNSSTSFLGDPRAYTRVAPER